MQSTHPVAVTLDVSATKRPAYDFTLTTARPAMIGALAGIMPATLGLALLFLSTLIAQTDAQAVLRVKVLLFVGGLVCSVGSMALIAFGTAAMSVSGSLAASAFIAFAAEQNQDILLFTMAIFGGLVAVTYAVARNHLGKVSDWLAYADNPRHTYRHLGALIAWIIGGIEVLTIRFVPSAVDCAFGLVAAVAFVAYDRHVRLANRNRAVGR